LLDFLLGWTTLDIYGDDWSREPDHRPPYRSIQEPRPRGADRQPGGRR